MLKTKKEIESWLIKHGVRNFIVNKNLTVDVKNTVFLIDKNLIEIPIIFREILGSFYCSENYLISLRNTPKKVKGNFDCSNNDLINLDFSPKEIQGDFDCSNNNLTNLINCPKKINGDFYLQRNNIKKESLFMFETLISGEVISDFGNKKDFFYEVKKQKLIRENLLLNKNSKKSEIIKKRL